MNSTFYEKMLENLLVSLEHYLPILAGKIVAFLEDNPSLNLIVKVHTDSRGNDKYNKELTETQAKSIEQWLVKKGKPFVFASSIEKYMTSASL